MIKYFMLAIIISSLLNFFNPIILNNILATVPLLYINISKVSQPHNLSEIEMKYVAHAGGGLEDYTYLNNLEAIRNSYNNGVRLIELDVEFTTDNKPIMLHSWDGFVTKFFGVEAWRTYTYEEFKNFKMINGWHQLTLEDTIFYMETEFKEMYLITDTKNDNKHLLNIISNEYPHMKKRIIPQVYNQEEYKYAKDLGFENVIYTLYVSPDTNEQVIEFCKQNTPFAITMPHNLAYYTTLPTDISKLGINTYTHTINDMDEYNFLINKGLTGIYTDYILGE